MRAEGKRCEKVDDEEEEEVSHQQAIIFEKNVQKGLATLLVKMQKQS